MNRLNILYLPSWYPNRTNPFHGDFIWRHALAIQKHADLFVIYIGKDKQLKSTFELEFATENHLPTCRVYYRDFQSPFSALNKLVSYLRYKKGLKLALDCMQKNGFKPDIIHSHILLKAGWTAQQLAQKQNIPWIHTEHWSSYLPQTNWFEQQSKWHQQKSIKIAQQADYTTAVSSFLLDALHHQQLLGKRNVVISNTVDTTLFNFQIETTKTTSKVVLLHVSSLGAVKNIDVLLEAFHAAYQRNNNLELLVIGGAAERNAAFAKRYQHEAITYLEPLPYATVAAYMKKADYLILTSEYETQSCVALEALCCGLPVICTAVGGLPEFITQENGILVTPNATNELQTVLATCDQQLNRFDKKQIAQKAMELYNYNTIGLQFVACYQQAIKQSNATPR